MKKQKSFQAIRHDSGKTYNSHAAWDARYKMSDWTNYRLAFLKINSRCYSCGATATVVDHLISWKGDEKLFVKEGNHIPLCSRCHNTITTKFDRNFRPGSTIVPKLKWMANNRVLNNIDFKVRVIPWKQKK